MLCCCDMIYHIPSCQVQMTESVPSAKLRLVATLLKRNKGSILRADKLTYQRHGNLPLKTGKNCPPIQAYNCKESQMVTTITHQQKDIKFHFWGNIDRWKSASSAYIHQEIGRGESLLLIGVEAAKLRAHWIYLQQLYTFRNRPPKRCERDGGMELVLTDCFAMQRAQRWNKDGSAKEAQAKMRTDCNTSWWPGDREHPELTLCLHLGNQVPWWPALFDRPINKDTPEVRSPFPHR